MNTLGQRALTLIEALVVALVGGLLSCSNDTRRVAAPAAASSAVTWLNEGGPESYEMAVDEAIIANEVRYVIPVETPYESAPLKHERFLMAHRAGWENAILTIQLEELEAGWPAAPGGATCCEAVEPVTMGWYAGQRDASHYATKLQKAATERPFLINFFARIQEAIRSSPIQDWYIRDR